MLHKSQYNVWHVKHFYWRLGQRLFSIIYFQLIKAISDVQKQNTESLEPAELQ